MAIVLLDIIMDGIDGYGVLEFMKNENMIETLPVILITSDNSLDLEKKAYPMGVSDIIIKPFDRYIVDSRVNNIISLYQHKNGLEELVREQTQTLISQANRLAEINYRIIDALGSVVEYRGIGSEQHFSRVRDFTRILCDCLAKNHPEYGLTEKEIDMISHGASLRDMGMIAIPDSILLKPGRLTQPEFEIMKSHTMKGYDIVQKMDMMDSKDFTKCCGDIVLYHHEKYDGKGYPKGLKGDEIPISAQIVSLADVYDALISEEALLAMNFDENQLNEIALGVEKGIDISSYYNPDIPWFEMEEIRECLCAGIRMEDYEQYDRMQIREIRLGKIAGIDTTIYENPAYLYPQMEELRLGLENHLDVSIYANSSFDWYQMKEIRLGLEDGLDV